MASRIQHQLFELQERAYQEATLEKIGNEWLLFDNETEDATTFNQERLSNLKFQVQLKNGSWTYANFCSTEFILVYGEQVQLYEGMQFRILKQLQYAYEQWLVQLATKSFEKYVLFLNEIGYSLYDLVYCHNFEFFLPKNEPQEGVNILIYDNHDMICSVHHFFHRNPNLIYKDRFEFTLVDGTKHILANI